MVRISGIASRALPWCVTVAMLFICLSMLAVGVTATSVSDDKEASYKVSDRLSSLTDAAQSAYTAALAEAADRYSKAMSAVSVQISGEPEPTHGAMLASVSNAYFGAIASAHQAAEKAMANIIPAATPEPTPTTGYMEWAAQAQSLAQKHLDDSVKWASGQYEQAKVAIGAADATSAPGGKADGPLELARLNYYAGLGAAHDRYNEFLAAVSAAASSWTAATPTATPNLAERAGENWDWLVAQVSDKVYGAPTPTPAVWYENYYSQATQVPSAVHSLVSELLVGKEPTYSESVLAQLAAAYSKATETVGSVYAEATQAVDDVIDSGAEALGNAGRVVIEKIGEMGDKVRDTIGEGKERSKDEL